VPTQSVRWLVRGKVSNFIIDSLLIGDTVQALAPAGEFNCVDHPPREFDGQRKALLISAGCGVTPVFAMAKHWLSNEMNVDIEFLHIARSAQETIYFDHLSTCQSAYAHFHLKPLWAKSVYARYARLFASLGV